MSEVSASPASGRNPADAPLIDTHCHLDAEGFQQDLDDVLARARQAGVEQIVTIGTSWKSSQAAVLLANRFPEVVAVVGIHPNYATEAAPDDFERIADLATHPRVVGIGETGLDRYWDSAPIDVQTALFHQHIELARRLHKPFIVHCRDAEADVLAVLREQAGRRGSLTGIMHAFSGSAATAAECVTLGMHISFAGMLTFKKNEALRAVAATVPASRLLVETDAPYLAPQPFRGKRNEPAHVKQTCEVLAASCGVTPDVMARQTTANARALFRTT
jgi:TatD DNase family protein